MRRPVLLSMSVRAIGTLGEKRTKARCHYPLLRGARKSDPPPRVQAPPRPVSPKPEPHPLPSTTGSPTAPAAKASVSSTSPTRPTSSAAPAPLHRRRPRARLRDQPGRMTMTRAACRRASRRRRIRHRLRCRRRRRSRCRICHRGRCPTAAAGRPGGGSHRARRSSAARRIEGSKSPAATLAKGADDNRQCPFLTPRNISRELPAQKAGCWLSSCSMTRVNRPNLAAPPAIPPRSD